MDGAILVAVCSKSASEDEYSSFISRLKNRHKIGVKYVSLSSHNQLEDSDFSQFDAVVLIHSISRGRLSITDVGDAQYGKFLLRTCDQLGKGRVAVLVHGMQDPNTLEKAFAREQPTTMKCSSWVKLCTDLLQKDVDKMMEDLLSQLDKFPKPTLHAPKPLQAVGSEDKATRQVKKVTVQIATFKGVGGKLDIPDINLVICAEGCTRDSILQSLCQTKVNKIFLCTVFEETNDTWKHIQVNKMSRAGPKFGSSPYLRALLFIYRDKIPPEFNDEMMRELVEMQTGIGDTEPKHVEVKGTTDEKCVSDILHIASSSRRDRVTHIVSVTPRMGQESSDVYHKADGLSFQLVHGKISRAELEYQMEEDQKKQKRSQIRKLEDEMGECESVLSTLNGEISSLKKEKEKCSGNILHLQEDIEKLKEQKSRLSSKCDAEKDRAKDFSIEADILKDTIITKRKVMEELETNESSLKQVIEETTNKNSQKLKEMEEKEKKHTEECQKIAIQLSNERKQFDLDRKASEQELGLATEQTEKLRKECRELTSKLQKLKSNVHKEESTLNTIREEHTKINEYVSELSEVKTKREAELQSMRLKLEQLQIGFEQLESTKELQNKCKHLVSLFQALDKNVEKKEGLLELRRKKDEDIKDQLSRIQFDGKKMFPQKKEQNKTEIEQFESALWPQAEKQEDRSSHPSESKNVNKNKSKSKDSGGQLKTLSERAHRINSKLAEREKNDNDMIAKMSSIKVACKHEQQELQKHEIEILRELCNNANSISDTLDSTLQMKRIKLTDIEGIYDTLKEQFNNSLMSRMTAK